METKDILSVDYSTVLTDKVLHDLTETQKIIRDIEMNVASDSFKRGITSKPRRNKRKKR